MWAEELTIAEIEWIMSEMMTWIREKMKVYITQRFSFCPLTVNARDSISTLEDILRSALSTET